MVLGRASGMILLPGSWASPQRRSFALAIALFFGLTSLPSAVAKGATAAANPVHKKHRRTRVRRHVAAAGTAAVASTRTPASADTTRAAVIHTTTKSTV